MELSLSPLACLKISSVIRPTRYCFSHQTKIPAELSGNSGYPSSKGTRDLPSKKRWHLRSCSKLTPNGSYWRKAIPIRVYTDQTGEENSGFEAEAENLEQKIANNIQLGAYKSGSEAGVESLVKKIANYGKVLGKFMRSFVIIAVTIQFTVFVSRTWMENSHLLHWSNGSVMLKTLTAYVSILCANVFTSGINQIYDVEIDKINKPDLPIAAGELSLQSACLIVTSYVIISLSLARLINSGLFTALICFQFFLGSIYSIPPFRMKESTIGAMVTCALIQGFAPMICFHTAARATVGLPFEFSPPVIFLSFFSTFYAFTMGFMKDITDVEGDKKHNIRTLATILGVDNVVFLGCGIFLITFGSAILTAIFMPQAFKAHVMIPAHILFSVGLISQARKLHKANYSKEASTEFYIFCWKLFHSEYLLFPFI